MYNFSIMKKWLFSRLILLFSMTVISSCSVIQLGGSNYKLNLSRSHLTEIPDYVCNMTELTELNLHNNKIRRISPKIQNLKNLRKLIISSNEIDSLPDEIRILPNIEII